MPPRRTKEEPIEEEVDGDIVNDDEDEDDLEEDDESSDAFEPAEKIQECHWQRRSVKDLCDMMATPYLELNPDYQRDVVWTPDRMTGLINSLMCNYYVPPVIFNVQTTMADGQERYFRISIDGKQRLSSIREFVNGNIPCTDKNGRKWYFTNNNDSTKKSKRILHDRVKQRFLRLEILCAEYAALERKQEEDLFSRVQLGVPLTPAEKLRASSGAWQAFAVDIERQYPELMDTVDNRRGRSFQLVLQIFKQLLNSDDQSPKYNAGATSLKGFCDRPQLLDESFRATARRVFHTYNEILKKHPETFENHNYTHATKYSPIEFVATAVLIHQYPQRTNPTLLSGDILHMRREIRKERQDLRSNSNTWKAVTDFINDLEKFRGGANVASRDAGRGILDMSMSKAGEGGSSFLLQPKVSQVNIELQPAAARTRGPPIKKPILPTAPSMVTNPAQPPHSLPQGPDMNVRNGHLRFQTPREQLPQPLTGPSAQRQPSTAPPAQRQLQSAPVAQRQPPPSPHVRASIAFGQATRSVADRFRAVNTSPKSNPAASYGGSTRTWDGSQNGNANGVGDGYSQPRGTNYGQRPSKRPRTESEAMRIKSERHNHD